MYRKLIYGIVAAALLVAPMPNASTLSSVGSEFDVWVDPSKTWVGIARVHLEVTDLRSSGSELTGRYRIRVPLAPSRNDSGTLELKLAQPLDHLQEAGGKAAGNAHSEVNGKTRSVDCRIRPGGLISIHVTTDDRTLKFKTKYRPSRAS